MGMQIFIASSFIHIPWILIESVAAFNQYKKSNEKCNSIVCFIELSGV
jgi:hypothetical protein